MKVLLVEDEAALSDVMARNLRARGHEVTAAATAEAAVLEMAHAWPDVLILDVNLPDMTGWDILRGLSAKERESLPAIVISAAPISQKRIEEFRPFRALLKPFPIDALVRALDAAADVHRKTGAERQG
jgi:DNA-binding response OmpR family regulator